MIQIKNLSKQFITTQGEIAALNNISLEINKGAIYGIVGESGAGKSTLVRCINLLERPTSGEVIFDGRDLTKLSEKELRLARKKIGMIFQQFHLLEQRNALDNVCYPLEIIGYSKKDARERAEKLLKLVGLEDRIYNYPSQLSGGQKQRVAIARALATEPEVLLCDEATSALDPATTDAILDLLKKINETLGVTIIIITHEMRVVEEICTEVAILNKGTLKEKGYVEEIFARKDKKQRWKLIS